MTGYSFEALANDFHMWLSFGKDKPSHGFEKGRC